MTFLTINQKSIHKMSVVLFAVMSASWLLMLLLKPFSSNGLEPGIGAEIPGGILELVYATAFISPFVSAIYSWFLTFNYESKNSRIFGIVSAILATAVSLFTIFWVIQ